MIKKKKQTSVVLDETTQQEIARIQSLSGRTQSHVIQTSLTLGLHELRQLLPSLLGKREPGLGENYD